KFTLRLLQGVATKLGVESAALISSLPLEEDISASGFYVEGKPEPQDISQIPIAIHCAVSPGYFRTMGIRLLRGRDFTDADIEGKEQVVIVDETIARRHFADVDPIGRRIRFGGSKSGRPWLTVIGVAGAGRGFWVEEEVRVDAFLAPHAKDGGEFNHL